MNIQELPTEMLDEIFAFLPFPDQSRCRVVCQRWIDILNASRYLSRRALVFTGDRLREKNLQTLSEPLKNVIIRVEPSQFHSGFRENIGCHVENLDAGRIRLQLPHITLPQFPNLQEISVSQLNSSIVNLLPKSIRTIRTQTLRNWIWGQQFVDLYHSENLKFLYTKALNLTQKPRAKTKIVELEPELKQYCLDQNFTVLHIDPNRNLKENRDLQFTDVHGFIGRHCYVNDLIHSSTMIQRCPNLSSFPHIEPRALAAMNDDRTRCFLNHNMPHMKKIKQLTLVAHGRVRLCKECGVMLHEKMPNITELHLVMDYPSKGLDVLEKPIKRLILTLNNKSMEEIPVLGQYLRQFEELEIRQSILQEQFLDRDKLREFFKECPVLPNVQQLYIDIEITVRQRQKIKKKFPYLKKFWGYLRN